MSKKERRREKSNNSKIRINKISFGKLWLIIIHGELKKIIIEINEKIKVLNYIKNALIIFHRKDYGTQINELTNIIIDIETLPIKEFKDTECWNQ